MSKIIGIDIAKQTIDAAILAPDGSVQTQLQKVPNNEQGFIRLLEAAAPDADAQFVMEASGPYYLPLASWLYNMALKVSVVNPLVIRHFCKMRLSRTKTDKKDAVMIAQYGRKENPDLWKPQAELLSRLQQMQTAARGYEKSLTLLGNQLGALRFAKGKDIDPFAEQSFMETIAFLKRQQKEVEKQMRDLAKEHFSDCYGSLLSIPGIGPKTAILLICVTDGFKRFSNPKQLLSYLGLSPRTEDSGTSVKKKAHISKMGTAALRKSMYVCSWSAKRFNKGCRELYERLLQKGKPERVIKVAIAAKLVRVAYAVASTHSTYQDHYRSKAVLPAP